MRGAGGCQHIIIAIMHTIKHTIKDKMRAAQTQLLKSLMMSIIVRVRVHIQERSYETTIVSWTYYMYRCAYHNYRALPVRVLQLQTYCVQHSSSQSNRRTLFKLENSVYIYIYIQCSPVCWVCRVFSSLLGVLQFVLCAMFLLLCGACMSTLCRAL